MSNNKPRIIKDFKKLDADLQEKIKLAYPFGFSDNLITFTNKDGALVSALPFETEDKYYLLRMSEREAVRIIEMDEDYDDDGNLKQDVRSEYEEKHYELEGMEDDFADDMADDDADNDIDDDMDDDVADEGEEDFED